jgi:hypothetical protein
MHNTPRRVLNRMQSRTSIQATAMRHGQVAVVSFQLQLLSARLCFMTLPDRLLSSSITPRVHLTHVRSRSAAVALSDPTLTASALDVRATICCSPTGERNTAEALVKQQGSRVGGVCRGILLVES